MNRTTKVGFWFRGVHTLSFHFNLLFCFCFIFNLKNQVGIDSFTFDFGESIFVENSIYKRRSCTEDDLTCWKMKDWRYQRGWISSVPAVRLKTHTHTHNFRVKFKKLNRQEIFLKLFAQPTKSELQNDFGFFCVVVYHWHWFQLTSNCNGKGAREHIETRKKRARLSILFFFLFFLLVLKITPTNFNRSFLDAHQRSR